MGPVGAVYAFADVVVDARAHRLIRDGREVALEPKAFAVLLQLLARPGQLLTRNDLLDLVWGHSYVAPSTLSRVIAQLRRALGDDSEQPHCIQTVHGLGYRFIASLGNQSAEPPPVLDLALSRRARLPERTFPLIGRDEDLARLELLLHDARLVTIVGAGGIGKTQAALELARRVAVDFPDGVWLFDCTSLNDGAEFVPWLAGLFDIRMQSDADELMGRLGELLNARKMLLLFDNCERIAGPMGMAIEALLAASAESRVLVTSQHRLNCAGETICWLPPLGLPPTDEWSTDADIVRLSGVPAVQLLLMRSRAFGAGFILTPANAAAVAGICRRLDGLPLALEIAAARLRLLSPEQLLERMDAHLLSLAGTVHSRPERHRTLHALIEWSFALLTEREQSMLCGLGVFVGPCTLEGAAAVGVAFGLDDEQIMDALVGLVDKSLLVVDATTSPPGYRLLDSVRLFALEKLAESADEERMRDAHLAYFVRFSERVDAEIRSEREQLWFDRVRREWRNLQIALDHAMSSSDRTDQALAISGGLCWYFRSNAHYADSARWIERALSVRSAPTHRHAQALIAGGIVQHQMQVHDRAQALLCEGIALARQLGDLQLAGAGQAVLAFELTTCGDTAGAEVHATAALAIANAENDAWLRSMTLMARGAAFALEERHGEAETSLGEAYEAVSGPGFGVFQRALVRVNRALQRWYLGRFQDAASDWLSCFDELVGMANWRAVAGCVEGAAYLLSVRGEAEQSTRFLAAAANVRELTAAPLMPHWHKAQATAEQTARDALGSLFEQAWKGGVAARFEQIAVEARAVLTALASGAD